MNLLKERFHSEAIECHDLLGEHAVAKTLKEEFKFCKEEKLKQKRGKMVINKNQFVKSILMASSWDQMARVIESTLNTDEYEDIPEKNKLIWDK